LFVYSTPGNYELKMTATNGKQTQTGQTPLKIL
jgi:PKD repeat protein